MANCNNTNVNWRSLANSNLQTSTTITILWPEPSIRSIGDWTQFCLGSVAMMTPLWWLNDDERACQSLWALKAILGLPIKWRLATRCKDLLLSNNKRFQSMQRSMSFQMQLAMQNRCPHTHTHKHQNKFKFKFKFECKCNVVQSQLQSLYKSALYSNFNGIYYQWYVCENHQPTTVARLLLRADFCHQVCLTKGPIWIIIGNHKHNSNGLPLSSICKQTAGIGQSAPN